MPANKKIEAKLYHQILTDTASVPNLLLRHYPMMGLNTEELTALLQVIASHPKNSGTFNLRDLRNYFEGGEAQARRAVALLLQKKIISHIDDEENYSLQPMYEKMMEVLVFIQVNDEEKKRAKRVRKSAIGELYEAFENELARPLSPVESKRINDWMSVDGWPAAMIKEALHRAVIHGTCNLMYIEKILESWRRKGITTLQQAYDETSKKKNSAAVRVSNPQKPKVEFTAEGTDYNAILNKKR